jgi:protein involved in plasmid replication-relaxation
MNAASFSIDLQDRDIILLQGLFESRVMSSPHLTALYFEGRAEAAKKRLQKLKAAGLVNERPRRAHEPAVLFLTLQGFKLLTERGSLAHYPKISAASFEKRVRVSPLTLRHELDVMAAKTALAVAVSKTPTFTIAEFSTWPVLSQFIANRPAVPGHPRSPAQVKPDGFIRIREKAADGLFEHTFFLEIDRSTETLETLALKAACYIDFYKTGGMAVRHGQPRSAYRDFPFRVLMVFKTPERRNNCAGFLLRFNPPILTQTWLATFDEVLRDPLGTIWIRPGDYRDAAKGTPFDTDRNRHPSAGAYRRQMERELLVDESIKRNRLLE